MLVLVMRVRRLLIGLEHSAWFSTQSVMRNWANSTHSSLVASPVMGNEGRTSSHSASELSMSQPGVNVGSSNRG